MTAPPPQSLEWLENLEDRFRKEFDELKLKPPKNSMPNLERELIIDFWRKAILQKFEEAERRGYEKGYWQGRSDSNNHPTELESPRLQGKDKP